MRILVCAASRHGSTAEVADVIADVLREHDLDVERCAPEEISRLNDVDAVVLGSAVYMGHWLRPAREFAYRHHTSLNDLPVWLFSVGPVGEPLRPAGDPPGVSELIAVTRAREHRLFAGRLERVRLTFGERLVTAIMRVGDGDYRPTEEIRSWAGSIADTVTSSTGQGI